MDITVWEGITNNFKIEVIHFMVKYQWQIYRL